MIIHTVEPGESVYSIAKKYNVPPSRIITDNLLSNPSKLSVGQDIIILYPTETHTVKGGETLSGIAAQHGLTLLDLYRNNPILSGSERIYPSQVLNISYENPPLGKVSTIGYAYTSIDPMVLRRTLPYLTYLSVFPSGISEDGSIISPMNEENLINTAYEYDTTPLLVLTSLTTDGRFSSAIAERVLSDTDFGDTVIRNAADAVREKNYGGIDVDFEYIPAEYSAAYADFIRRLNVSLGGDYPVFVSLAPKTSESQRGLLYEGHDYAALGDAADGVLLMTYEWGYTYGPPLPVSPINEVRRVIDYAVEEIPRGKIFMGIPNYGYDWALPYVRGETRAESLSNEAALSRAWVRNAEIQYDENAQAPYYTYWDRPQTYSDAIEHIVWFENARSSQASLGLINEMKLEGGGVWNIMNYFPAFWTVLNQLFEIEK